MNFDDLFRQREYADRLQMRLEKFQKQSYSPYKSNFRCDICGDSQKDKSKRRGYITEKSGELFYYCHNCGASNRLLTYLRDNHKDLFDNYMADSFEGKKVNRETPIVYDPTAFMSAPSYTKGLVDIMDMTANDPAVQYLAHRRLPRPKRGEYFWCEKFYTHVNRFQVGRFSDVAIKWHEHSRIIMPLRKENGDQFGIIGRTIADHSPKYLTLKFEEHNKFYGLDTLDKTKPAITVEGALDSKFLTNCVALAGADGNVDELFPDRRMNTIVLDNQPRNKAIVEKMMKLARGGYQICVWPSTMVYEDINDMVKEGRMKPAEIEAIIASRTFIGMEAEFEVSLWQKL